MAHIQAQRGMHLGTIITHTAAAAGVTGPVVDTQSGLGLLIFINVTAISVVAAPTLNAPSTATTGGTLAAATYYYKVSAITPNGETAGSNEVSQITTGTTSTVTLTWNAVSGATGYRIYRGTAAGTENVYYSVGAVTTYTDTGAASTAGSPLSAASATLTATLSGLIDESATASYTILASAAITATGLTVLRVYPGLAAAANLVANDVVPGRCRITTAIGGTAPSVTATISAYSLTAG